MLLSRVQHYVGGGTNRWYQLVLNNSKKFDFFQRIFFSKEKIFFSKVVHFSKKMISILTLSRKRKFRLKVGTNFGTTGWCWYQHSVVPTVFESAAVENDQFLAKNGHFWPKTAFFR